MKAGYLKTSIAKAMLVTPAVAWRTMRNLRENGWLTTGARGVNAPDMTYLDAARVLIAHIAESNPGRRAPHYVETLGSIPCVPEFAWEGEPFTLQELVPELPINTFEQAVAALIAVFTECRGTKAFNDAGKRMRDGDFQNPQCRVEIFPEDKAAQIIMNDSSRELGNATYSFQDRPHSVRDWSHQSDERFRLGRQEISFVNQEVIAVIAEGFRAANDQRTARGASDAAASA